MVLIGHGRKQKKLHIVERIIGRGMVDCGSSIGSKSPLADGSQAHIFIGGSP
jgi:hypothetical protein